MELGKTIGTVTAIIAAVGTTYDVMIKTFKWFEKRHKKENTKDMSRPIIKGA